MKESFQKHGPAVLITALGVTIGLVVVEGGRKALEYATDFVANRARKSAPQQQAQTPPNTETKPNS